GAARMRRLARECCGTGGCVEDGVEIATGVELRVGLDGGHADDAGIVFVGGEQFVGAVDAVELRGTAVVVGQLEVDVQGGAGGGGGVMQRGWCRRRGRRWSGCTWGLLMRW